MIFLAYNTTRSRLYYWKIVCFHITYYGQELFGHKIISSHSASYKKNWSTICRRPTISTIIASVTILYRCELHIVHDRHKFHIGYAYAY